MTGVIAGRDVVFDDGVLRITRIDPPPERLMISGGAAEDGYQPLVKAPEELTDGNGSGPSEVHLELPGPESCDAAVLHAMIVPAADGGRDMLYRPVAELRALFRIVGWDELRGLRVVTGQ